MIRIDSTFARSHQHGAALQHSGPNGESPGLRFGRAVLWRFITVECVVLVRGPQLRVNFGTGRVVHPSKLELSAGLLAPAQIVAAWCTRLIIRAVWKSTLIPVAASA